MHSFITKMCRGVAYILIRQIPRHGRI